MLLPQALKMRTIKLFFIGYNGARRRRLVALCELGSTYYINYIVLRPDSLSLLR